ncbi:MAG TPA: hypothetical protein VMT52_03455, partial [Planctomycetota bacterium]|nr:hypothetical protein [Planctomycetota bacterium]
LEMPDLEPGTYKLVVSSPVAKLGQDIAACFFNVKPSPFSVSVVKSALGSDQRVVLGPGVHRATCDGDGAVWISLERTGPAEVKGAAINLASAELRLNGKKTEAEWAVIEGKMRSSPLALESFERQNTLSVSVTDTRGREFEQVLGKLEVVPVPLKYEVTWTRPPPRDMGRGEFMRVEGALTLRGGLRAQRDRAREQILDVNKPFFVVTPASVLKGFEILRAPPQGGEEGVSPAIFGASVPFIATLRVDAADPAVKDRVLVEVRAEDPASGSVSALEARDVGIGPSTWQLAAGRMDAQGVLVPDDDLPLLARERLRLRIDDAGANAGESGETFRIQVFAAEGETGGASKPVASADSRELDWTPRKEGAYRIVAERALGDGSGWAADEKLEILPPLRMEWSRDLGSTIKLDSGQKLPIAIRIHGPPGLDQDTFGRWFLLEPEVLAEGGQRLSVEFTDWELSKDASEGTVEASAVSSKPVLTAATKVRVSLEPRSTSPDAGAMDVIDLDLVRGGGSLVLLEDSEEGSHGRVLKDLSGSFQLVYQKPVRIGYRLGTSLNVGESLERGVAAIITAPDGSEKVLDVETATTELVAFTPYEPTRYGTHRFHLEIRGKTPLLRDFEFEVIKGTAEWIVVAAVSAVGLIALGIVGFLLLKGRAYGLDRSKVRERIRARKEKALLDLQAEPKESLEGAVRLNVAAAAIGPFQLGGAPSIREVEAWVDQHFSMDAAIFSDPSRNEKRRPLIEGLLAEARTELLLETEKRLPVRGAEVCIRSLPADGKNGDLPRIEAEVVQDPQAPRAADQKPLVSLQILAGGKLRVTTSSGKSVTMPLEEEFAYNGWIGKSGNQIRASVKVPGIPDYSTLIIDLKS